MTNIHLRWYKLASDVWGIGFKTADTIAACVGIAKDSPERIKAGLACTLSQAADDGHCYLPEPRLVTDAAKILEVPADLIAPRVADLAAEDGAVIETLPVPGAAAAEPLRAVCLPPFFHAERSLAAVLRSLLATGKDRLPAFQSVDWDKALGWLKTRTGAPKQGRCGQDGPHREGRGADGRAGVREELHRAFGS